MKEWLAKIRPPKYLRYLFFIIYSWYRRYKSEKNDAHNTAIIFLWGTHAFFILSLLFVCVPHFVVELGKYKTILPLQIFIGVVFYYSFWYKRKWKFYIEEFNYIKINQRRLGLVFLFLYFFIIITFFIFSVYSLIEVSPYYN